MHNAERDEGFDGVGSYAACGEPRENYAARYREQWTSHHEKRLATGLTVVPCVAMDRNPQPRIDAPVVWYGYPEGNLKIIFAFITGVYNSCIYKHVCTTIFYYGSGKRKVGQKNDMF